MALINQRRGIIIGSQDEGIISIIEAQAPLAEMFGFSTALRSSTQGKAQFTMEFELYKKVPEQVYEAILKTHKKGKNK